MKDHKCSRRCFLRDLVAGWEITCGYFDHIIPTPVLTSCTTTFELWVGRNVPSFDFFSVRFELDIEVMWLQWSSLILVGNFRGMTQINSWKTHPWKFFDNIFFFVQYRDISGREPDRFTGKLVQSPISEFKEDDKANFWKTHPNKLTIYRLIDTVGHRPISGRITKNIRMSFPWFATIFWIGQLFVQFLKGHFRFSIFADPWLN